MNRKSKKCKVKYVDELKTDFEVKSVEIMIEEYRIYGRTKETGYKLLATKKDENAAINYANNLNKNKYNGILVIGKSQNGDIPIDLER